MYKAYVTRIKNVRKHPNANKLQLGECFGNTVCVNLDYEDNQLGIYFPTDGQLSKIFCEKNNLIRKKDENGVNIGGYMDPDKRNVTAIKLRGEKSDGLFLPIESLSFFGDITSLKEGDCFSVFNGSEICTKYIPRVKIKASTPSEGNRARKKKVPVAPLFKEHADTEQLAYNLGMFRAGDQIEITLKMHGTSARTAYVPTFKGYKRTALDKLLRREGKPIYDWGYVSGTRRTVLEDYEGGYYGSNAFREPHSKFFEGKLWKGETVYYEIVGFTNSGTPIMSSCNNKKLNDKEFIKQYGEETVFSYGCEPHSIIHEGYNDSFYGYQNEHIEYKFAQSDIYVYRMTMTNEDGDVVEYTPDFIRYRCEQMGAKCVPVMWKGYIPKDEDRYEQYFVDNKLLNKEISAGDWIKCVAERYYDGPDPIGKTHIREGVVVRIINRPKFAAYKHKNFSFKALEGIIKIEAETADMEEAQEEIVE